MKTDRRSVLGGALERLGRLFWFTAELVRATGVLLLGGYGLGALSWFKRTLVLQVWFTGVQALLLATGAGIALAGIMLGVGWETLASFGAQEYMGDLMRLAVLEELAPLLTALIVTARSGTAITTELARMRLHHEVDALEIHGVPPLAFLGAPRLVGVPLANLVLTVVVCAVSYLTTIVFFADLNTFSRPVFSRLLVTAVLPVDVLLCLVKGLLFGLAITPFTLFEGLTMVRDPNEVPRAGTRAVVSAMVAVFTLDALLAVVR